MYYSIVTAAGGWGVRFSGRTLATFATHAEASAYIKGRQSLASAVNPESVKEWYARVREGMGQDWRAS